MNQRLVKRKFLSSSKIYCRIIFYRSLNLVLKLLLLSISLWSYDRGHYPCLWEQRSEKMLLVYVLIQGIVVQMMLLDVVHWCRWYWCWWWLSNLAQLVRRRIKEGKSKNAKVSAEGCRIRSETTRNVLAYACLLCMTCMHGCNNRSGGSCEFWVKLVGEVAWSETIQVS